METYLEETPFVYNHKEFDAIKSTSDSAVLHSPDDYTFHLWSQKPSCMHAHDDYIEIFIVTKGKLVHHFGKKKFIMQVGDAFILFPNQYHKHSQYKNYYSQHLNLTCSLAHAADFFQLYFSSPNPSLPNQLIHLPPKSFELVLAFQDLVLDAKNEEEQDVAIKALLSFTFSLFHNTEVKENNTQPKWLYEFIQKLNNLVFTSDLKLTDIYALSHYSQSTLSREFKKHMGKTLISYINELKLNYACNQLKHTNLSVLEISSSLGFDSLSHFCHLFKKKYNLSPLQYRKNITNPLLHHPQLPSKTQNKKQFTF